MNRTNHNGDCEVQEREVKVHLCSDCADDSCLGFGWDDPADTRCFKPKKKEIYPQSSEESNYESN